MTNININSIGIDTIDKKVNIILAFIKSKNLELCLLNTNTKNCIYSLKTLLYAVCIKDYFNYSYRKYAQSLQLFKYKLPSKSRLENFINLLSKLKIYKQIHQEYILIHPELITNDISIDSTFLFNKSANTKSNFIGINPHYHNKFGTKLTEICNDTGFTLYFRLDSGNTYDARIASLFTESFKNNELFQHRLLADSGYDSSIFKKLLNNQECSYIIPKNKRNTLDENTKLEIKTEKEKLNNVAVILKKNIREKIKSLKKKNQTKHIVKKILELKKKIYDISLQTKKDIKIQTIYIKQQNKKKEKKQFNIGLTDDDKIIYKKRAYVEHSFGFKKRVTDRIKCKSMQMLEHIIYSTLVDKILFMKNNLSHFK